MDTTMGLTPLEGLMMGTRSGDVDPSLHLFLHQQEQLTLEEITDILTRKSGLLGVSGVSHDMHLPASAFYEHAIRFNDTHPAVGVVSCSAKGGGCAIRTPYPPERVLLSKQPRRFVAGLAGTRRSPGTCRYSRFRRFITNRSSPAEDSEASKVTFSHPRPHHHGDDDGSGSRHRVPADDDAIRVPSIRRSNTSGLHKSGSRGFGTIRANVHVLQLKSLPGKW